MERLLDSTAGQIRARLRLRGLVHRLPREPPCRGPGGGGGRQVRASDRSGDLESGNQARPRRSSRLTRGRRD